MEQLVSTDAKLNKRFWSKVDIKEENECWNWKGAKISNGRSGSSFYGIFKYKNKRYRSHRLAYFLINNEIPNMLVCHTCDNTLCCNPNHLFLGTSKDNHDDMKSKNRNRFGESHPKAILTELQVLEIRELGKTEPSRKLAKKYGVSRGAITGIIYNTNWKKQAPNENRHAEENND